MLVQLRVPCAPTLVAAPQAHSLKDLRRRAHPASWLSHGQASGARRSRPDACTGYGRCRHAKPAHVADPALDLGPGHQVLDARLVPGVGAHGVL
eukprot:3769124-Prorocentrum_lima.AAC.1